MAVKVKRRFHAIMKLKAVSGIAPNMILEDHGGKEHRMYAQDFTRLLKKAEWVGPLLVDGLWEEVDKYGGKITVRPVFAEQLED